MFPVVSSDPNDKSAVGVVPSGYVRSGDVITYPVLFESKPTAAASAEVGLVTDSLDANL